MEHMSERERERRGGVQNEGGGEGRTSSPPQQAHRQTTWTRIAALRLVSNTHTRRQRDKLFVEL
jgi:hypothetical protein